MSLPYNGNLIDRAQQLRIKATKQEKRLWYDFLRHFPVRFQRQKAISSFIADFYCAKAHLIIEVDGTQHYTKNGIAYDQERDAVLSKYGLEILRISNHEIDTDFPAVCEKIKHEVMTRAPAPLPPDGGTPL